MEEAPPDANVDMALVDNLLSQAHGDILGRLIAGSYRLALTAAGLKGQIDARDNEISRLVRALEEAGDNNRPDPY